MKNSIAICPGSFDPVTYGHLDIITRASSMFDKVIVVVAGNSSKHCSFTPEERVAMIKKCISDLPNVEVDHYGGLLADYAAQRGATAIIKGLRAMSDFEYEFQMALTNKKLNPNVETLFLTTAAQNMYLSSSMVKQIASMGGDISSFVPDVIRQDIADRIQRK
ncbi:MAG: pantetheine-phosphate adenylyltransferase [Clostridia bacterium]|nr:pantetheine-phosphate adenylyltransferase [Clostridia bacterium]